MRRRNVFYCLRNAGWSSPGCRAALPALAVLAALLLQGSAASAGPRRSFQSGGSAQPARVPAGEETFARLGCRNCHGRIGDGGKGKPGGPIIAHSQLSLAQFVGYVRLPGEMMPPYSPQWASDVELATVFQWLEGAEKFELPLPVRIDLRTRTGGKPPDGADEKGRQIEIAMTSEARTSAVFAKLDPSSLHYRFTLITGGKAPVASQPLEYWRIGQRTWSEMKTDQRGQVLLKPGDEFVAADVHQKSKVLGRLRLHTRTVPAVVVVEALGSANDSALIVGLGSTILRARE